MNKIDLKNHIETARIILSAPPAKCYIVRPEPVGTIVAEFVLPLNLCKPQNRTRHSKPWVMAQLKKAAHAAMFIQDEKRGRRDPLPGRPQVLCVRFSSREPDKYADWAKIAVDRLCVGPMGLGFLRDDRPEDVDLHQWWEPTGRKMGFVLVSVRSGVESVAVVYTG